MNSSRKNRTAVGNGLTFCLTAGRSSVTAKNVQMYPSSAEKLAAVRHCKGIDIWLLSHDFNGNNFRAFLTTAAGVNRSPMVSGSRNIL